VSAAPSESLLDRVTDCIAAAAAEEIKPRFGRLAAEDIRHKGPNDLVTTADLAMEYRLTRELADLLPGSLVVGEEAAFEDPSVLDRLDHGDAVWVIDPVDGTHNFTRSRPLVAVIVALVRRSETVAGWIHDPLTGTTVRAERGAGAWQDGRRLSAAEPGPVTSMLGTLSLGFLAEPLRSEVAAKRKGFVHPTTGWYCAGQEYMALCDGSLQFALYGGLKPWDHAAGVLMHEEAGGHSSLLDGAPYRPTVRDNGLLLAPDQASWQALKTYLLSSD
jgi:fructose-1,6-bisphosphatase/inositol monophosphatase family enzyme